MESLVSFVPIIIILVVIVVIVRWRKNANNLKNPTAKPSKIQRSSEQQVKRPTQPTYKSSVSVTSVKAGDKEIDLNVAEEELGPLMQEWSFIWEGEQPKQLTGTQAWFKQRNQNMFLKEEPDRALDLVLPFIPKQVAEHEQVRPHVNEGLTFGLGPLTQTLRELVKKCRKENQPSRDLEFPGFRGHSSKPCGQNSL